MITKEEMMKEEEQKKEGEEEQKKKDGCESGKQTEKGNGNLNKQKRSESQK